MCLNCHNACIILCLLLRSSLRETLSLIDGGLSNSLRVKNHCDSVEDGGYWAIRGAGMLSRCNRSDSKCVGGEQEERIESLSSTTH